MVIIHWPVKHYSSVSKSARVAETGKRRWEDSSRCPNHRRRDPNHFNTWDKGLDQDIWDTIWKAFCVMSTTFIIEHKKRCTGVKSRCYQGNSDFDLTLALGLQKHGPQSQDWNCFSSTTVIAISFQFGTLTFRVYLKSKHHIFLIMEIFI